MGNQDITWEHCTTVRPNNKMLLKCNYCGQEYHGGVFRLKHHLARTRKNVKACTKNSEEVIQLFKDVLLQGDAVRQAREDRMFDSSAGQVNQEVLDVEDRGERVIGKKKGTMDTYVKVGRDLVRPAVTRFATCFLTLKSVYQQKTGLITMFGSEDWQRSPYAKRPDGVYIEVKQRLYDCIERMIPSSRDRVIIDDQMDLFKGAKGLFARETAKLTRKTKQPANWWESYRDSAPELQRLAIRILSLTCSSSGYPLKEKK
ncbi:hypothetical protein HHK36_004563 [Tetracentron sinense]|uniref:BED-type domain-containing protein n=1 Tax=Tetracentron sinense TaxID=13715 RepID=A0A834ZQ93_TETSI|nr:hypothetical protein HHK36_004563 [Tetracentron sinense]